MTTQERIFFYFMAGALAARSWGFPSGLVLCVVVFVVSVFVESLARDWGLGEKL